MTLSTVKGIIFNLVHLIYVGSCYYKPKCLYRHIRFLNRHKFSFSSRIQKCFMYICILYICNYTTYVTLNDIVVAIAHLLPSSVIFDYWAIVIGYSKNIYISDLNFEIMTHKPFQYFVDIRKIIFIYVILHVSTEQFIRLYSYRFYCLCWRKSKKICV